MELEERLRLLEIREPYFDKAIDSHDSLLREACEQITGLMQEIDELRDQVNKLWDHVHEDRARIELTAEKAFVAFYKLFPEVGKAEDTLERIMRNQKKESGDQP